MRQLSRRTFLQGIAALPLALCLPRVARADAPLIRYDIASAQGAAMLEIYADAVARMQALGPDDPMSWTWQWYTHFVSGTTTKADEIARIFGAEATPASSLANEMWNTCQSHSGQNPNNFLPWHRMFLYFFECIVRQVSGHPEFAMPYWNYTSSDLALRGVVPQQFRLPGDALFGALYRPDRTRLANTGQPIQKYQSGDPMDISAAMAKANYSSSGGVQGFCGAIVAGIHGHIHVLVGTAKNMGGVTYAGRDPLFWAHHSSIDRMWASWNANGGLNPTTAKWADATFVFADGNGQRVSSPLRDYFDMDALGYGYDALIPAPQALATQAIAPAAATRLAGAVEELVATAPSSELGAKPTHALLTPVVVAGQATVPGHDTAPGKRTYLVLKNLHTWRQPEVLYDVYLTPAHGANGLNRTNLVGEINFFDAEFHDHGHGAMGTALSQTFYSFDVTALLRRFARSGNPDARGSLLVTFVPAGTPTADAKPLVGTIELVLQ